jgi:hypothetical protein
VAEGAGVDAAQLGDPLTPANGYRLCLYDSGGVVARLGVAGGGTCGSRPCWRQIGDSGYKYKNKSASSDGVSLLIAKGGAAGKSKILAKGRGVSLPLPSLPLDASSGVVAQLFRDDTESPCWQAVFPTALVNDTTMFKAKSQAP